MNIIDEVYQIKSCIRNLGEWYQNLHKWCDQYMFYS